MTESEKKFLIQFGKHLRRIRKEKGMTQADLVHQAGVHGNMIGRFERGERAANIIQLLKIAAVLEIKMEDLFIS